MSGVDPYCYNLGLRFQWIAALYADRAALRYPDGSVIGFAQLDAMSVRQADELLKAGVVRGSVVALLNEKSPQALAAMIACLRIGAVYTNLDVTNPWERLSRILERCKPALVLHEPSGASAEVAVQVVAHRYRVSALSQTSAASPDAAMIERVQRATAEVTGGDAAYIMFTSGSTGFPKGAVMTHENVLHLIDWGRELYNVTPEDVFTNVNPIYFDNSVFDLYVSLFNGASLVPFRAEHTRDAAALVRLVGELGCTSWFSVPSMLVYLLTMRGLSGSSWPDMRRIIFGGEGFPKARLKELHAHFGARCRLVNAYGPTECTCICTSYDVTARDFDDMQELAPLGATIRNFDHHIQRDASDAPDAPGELLLGGPCVGAGYYNDPERTAAAFVQDPREPHFRRVMYRSGDLVRLDEEGRLRFCGRVDNQIKLMGYRIELEEVEAAFNAQESVQEVGVVLRADGAGPGYLAAFVQARDTTSESLAGAVAGVLPPYMRPRKIIVSAEPLPKNRNGKVDRQALRNTPINQ